MGTTPSHDQATLPSWIHFLHHRERALSIWQRAAYDHQWRDEPTEQKQAVAPIIHLLDT